MDNERLLHLRNQLVQFLDPGDPYEKEIIDIDLHLDIDLHPKIGDYSKRYSPPEETKRAMIRLLIDEMSRSLGVSNEEQTNVRVLPSCENAVDAIPF